MNEFEQLQQQIDDIQKLLNSLKNSNSIPKEIDGAFRSRLGATVTTSDIPLANVTQHVNEAGSGTYDVATPPTGLVTVTLAGKKYTFANYS